MLIEIRFDAKLLAEFWGHARVRHDAGMLDEVGGPRFVEEALRDLGVHRVLGAQDLDRGPAADVIAEGFVHDTHAAFAELAKDAVVADALTDLEHGFLCLLRPSAERTVDPGDCRTKAAASGADSAIPTSASWRTNLDEQRAELLGSWTLAGVFGQAACYQVRKVHWYIGTSVTDRHKAQRLAAIATDDRGLFERQDSRQELIGEHAEAKDIGRRSGIARAAH